MIQYCLHVTLQNSKRNTADSVIINKAIDLYEKLLCYEKIEITSTELAEKYNMRLSTETYPSVKYIPRKMTSGEYEITYALMDSVLKTL